MQSLTPLWDDAGRGRVIEGLSLDRREVLVTTLVEAEPDYRQESPKPSLWPLAAALAVSALFVGSIFTPWALLWGAIPLAVALTLWFWPTRPRATEGPLRARS